LYAFIKYVQLYLFSSKKKPFDFFQSLTKEEIVRLIF